MTQEEPTIVSIIWSTSAAASENQRLNFFTTLRGRLSDGQTEVIATFKFPTISVAEDELVGKTIAVARELLASRGDLL